MRRTLAALRLAASFCACLTVSANEATRVIGLNSPAFDRDRRVERQLAAQQLVDDHLTGNGPVDLAALSVEELPVALRNANAYAAPDVRHVSYYLPHHA